jgi:uncharacterized membrane protein
MVLNIIAIVVGLFLILTGSFLVKLFYSAMKKKMAERDTTSLIVFASLELFSVVISTSSILFALTLILFGLFLIVIFTIDLIRTFIG